MESELNKIFRRSEFSNEVFWLIVFSAISVVVFALYVASDERADRAHEQRLHALMLAGQLRQSSDELTRMAQSYVVTANPLYKQHYQEILDIRNGLKPRPMQYRKIYWDLVLDDDVRPRPYSSEQVSLLERMKRAGFTQAECDKLQQAKANSDALTTLEFDAMKLSEAKGENAEELWQRARLMLYSAKYHQAKADIMKPIAEFEDMVDARTLETVDSAEHLSWALILAMMICFVAVMVLMARTYRALRNTLGGSPDEVKATIDQIARGNYSGATTGKYHQQNTVSEWLSAMQEKLRDSAQQQQHLTERLAAEKERAQVTLACIGDAVITTDAQGRVTFLNDVAAKLTDWTLDDARGMPLQEIFNIVNEATRQAVINPVDQVLKEGKTVLLANHTVLIARDGKEYNIEDSAAPIFLENGDLLGCVLVFHDVTDKHRLLRDVRWQAGHDVLTGLPNRTLLADRFERALASAQRNQENIAVCFLDLDEFKPVNDTYGHSVGDQLLVKAAHRIVSTIRAEDTVARLGGDEFVLLLGGLHNQREAEDAVQRVIDALNTGYEIKGETIKLSASVGVVMFPNDSAEPDVLLRHADQAMYQAKQMGRNRYHFFDVSQDKESHAAHQTHARVKQALQNGELALYYQPKVNMRSGTIVGMEALLRWQHPQRGVLTPDAFLPALEETNLIVEIGDWVMATALRQVSIWQAQGKALPVSVNIAARHLQNVDFLSNLKNILAQQADVPAQLLQIEILESAAQQDIDQVSILIMQCQALGLSFALDDFGTGYSSLNHLKHLPADELKIDRTFVRDMLEDREDLALVEAIIGLSKVFDRSIIAEGVENTTQGLLLMRLGCDLAQGYAIARPMPADDVLAWCQTFKPDPQWRKWVDVEWPLSDLPLMVATQDHELWVNQIVRALDDGSLYFVHAHLQNHHHCRFGQWYYGEGKARYGKLPDFGELREVHIELHRVGAEIIRLRDAGYMRAARELLPQLLTLKVLVMEKLELFRTVVSIEQ